MTALCGSKSGRDMDKGGHVARKSAGGRTRPSLTRRSGSWCAGLYAQVMDPACVLGGEILPFYTPGQGWHRI